MEPRAPDPHRAAEVRARALPVVLARIMRRAARCVCSIQALLSAPNPDDPLAENIAKHWKENEAEAVTTGACYAPPPAASRRSHAPCTLAAKEWTRLYAQP